MTELQREFELATRAEQRQRELERQRLLKKAPVSRASAELTAQPLLEGFDGWDSTMLEDGAWQGNVGH